MENETFQGCADFAHSKQAPSIKPSSESANSSTSLTVETILNIMLNATMSRELSFSRR